MTDDRLRKLHLEQAWLEEIEINVESILLNIKDYSELFMSFYRIMQSIRKRRIEVQDEIYELAKHIGDE